MPSKSLSALQGVLLMAIFAILAISSVNAQTAQGSSTYPEWVSNDYNCVIGCLQGFNSGMTTRPNPTLETSSLQCVTGTCDQSTYAGNLYQAQYIIQMFYSTGSIYENTSTSRHSSSTTYSSDSSSPSQDPNSSPSSYSDSSSSSSYAAATSAAVTAANTDTTKSTLPSSTTAGPSTSPIVPVAIGGINQSSYHTTSTSAKSTASGNSSSNGTSAAYRTVAVGMSAVEGLLGVAGLVALFAGLGGFVA